MERNGARDMAGGVGIATWEECLAVERSGQLPRYKAGHLRRFFLPPSYFILSSGADLQGGQRNLPEILLVFLDLTSQFLLLTFLTSAVG
jgi:hypothetical protein